MAKDSPFASLLNRTFGVGGVRPGIKTTISGDNEAIRALQELPDKIAMRVMRFALKKSQAPGISAAKSAASAIKTNRTIGVHLADTVISKVRTYRKNETIYGMIGFTGGASWLVEHGHRLVKGGTVARINKLRTDYNRAPYAKDRANTGAGSVIGQVPPHPYMAPAMQRVTGQMQEIFISELQNATGRAIAKIAAEAGVK